MTKKRSARDVDDYISSSDDSARAKLEELRSLIRSTIPKAEEKIWYGVPFYNYRGELAGFSALKNHVTFGFIAGMLDDGDRKMLEAEGYKLGKMTIRIRFNQNVPTAAIEKILRATAALNEDG